MMLGFILNGEDMIVKSDPGIRLIDLLRENFRLLGAKTGCLTGHCGLCHIILNGEVVKACLIPVFKIRGSELITIEGFSQTDEYEDIVSGFSEAGLENCGFCNTGKILAAEALLGRNRNPSEKEILAAFQGVKCRCTEPGELAAGVLKALEKRKRRPYA